MRWYVFIEVIWKGKEFRIFNIVIRIKIDLYSISIRIKIYIRDMLFMILK